MLDTVSGLSSAKPVAVYNISILPLVLAVVTYVCYRMNAFGPYRSCEEQGDWLGLTVCVLSLPCDVLRSSAGKPGKSAKKK